MSLSKLVETIENACSHNSYPANGNPPYVRGDLDRIVIAIESAFWVIPKDVPGPCRPARVGTIPPDLLRELDTRGAQARDAVEQ